MIKVTEGIITNLLKIHAPIKAIRLCRMIAKDYGDINKRDINSLLYSMQSRGVVWKNEKYEWSLGATKKDLISVKNVELSGGTEHGYKSINFSEEQEKAINFELNGNLLIRGQAGSGKTTVLAARAGKCMSVISKGSMLFLTYNTALCRYVYRSFKSLGSKNGLIVTTFHDWVKTTADKLGYYKVSWVDQRERTEQLKSIIKYVLENNVKHRLYDCKDPEIISWWNDEFAWIFGQGISDYDVYENAERVGRGTAIKLPANDREYIWLVFEKYLDWLDGNGKEDYDNVAGLLNKAIKRNGGYIPDDMRYDHVFLDEVQDFDRSWLAVLSE